MTTAFDARFYLALLIRRLPYVLLLIALTTLAGIVLAYKLPPVYRAESRLLVESPQIPDELAASTVRSSATEILLSIQQRILTTQNLLDLADRFAIFEETPTLPTDAMVAAMRARIVMDMPPLEQNTGIVTVSFEAGSPETSAAVTNELVDQIIQQSVELRTGASGGTLDFFQQEVQRLTEEMAQQNAKILEFEQANRNALPESIEYRRTRQSAQQERLLQVERELAGLRDRRERLSDLYERTGRVSPGIGELTPEQTRLEELRQQLASALVLYAPENPRVKALQVQVAALEEAVRQQLGGGSGDGAVTAFDLQMTDIDGQINFLNEQKIALEKELQDLSDSIDATPANAIVLGELRSDFENLRVQYDQAVQSLANARMGDRIEVTSRGQKISVIDPALPPSSPSAPNRKLLIAAGFMAGVLLNALVFFLLDVLNRKVRRPAELVGALGITPFGTIPYIETEQEISGRRRKTVTSLVLFVLGVPILMVLAVIALGELDVSKLEEMIGVEATAPSGN
jgi:succinoglycan biosynthesis transport protein ExoP